MSKQTAFHVTRAKPPLTQHLFTQHSPASSTQACLSFAHRNCGSSDKILPLIRPVPATFRLCRRIRSELHHVEVTGAFSSTYQALAGYFSDLVPQHCIPLICRPDDAKSRISTCNRYRQRLEVIPTDTTAWLLEDRQMHIYLSNGSYSSNTKSPLMSDHGSGCIGTPEFLTESWACLGVEALLGMG